MGWSDGLSSGGKYISTKIGTTVEGKVINIRKVIDKPDYEPSSKTGKQGFLFEFDLDSGTFSVGTFCLQTALKNSGVEVGDTLSVAHTGQNEYEVKVLSKGEAVASDTADAPLPADITEDSVPF